MDGPPLPDKRETLERLLPHGPALVRLDPRRPGVDVPPGLRAGPVLALKFSPRYANPLSLDDDALRQRLNFPEGPHSCVVPWDAVVAVGPDGRAPTEIWPLDLLGEDERTEDERTEDEPPPPPAEAPRPRLRLVKG